eukprot:TRINITY_DN22598_c0_g1_i1.p1 TRINITY_DN22598_c0_g1~~TRINITY_DN22598_c0_g1_i1.p1  ORF type:complete len:624 (+),score=249.32 TRINITY_DN22598_c0_g1_i1:86-1957(+)
MPQHPDLEEAEEILGKLCANRSPIQNAEVLKLIDWTEDVNNFLNNENYSDDIFSSFLTMVVDQLNNKEVHEHTKTRLLLVLNNCSMMRKARDSIFTAIKYIDINLENSMKVEGTMAFDPELGRMSEHMLVLLCRVNNYKIRAVDVLDFADGHVQFAVQLLLAILLKEPPYEFELRVNCMTAMLGFSQPSTFFAVDEGDSIQEKALTDFEDKINHICKLTKRLLVVRVVSQVISNPHLMRPGPVSPVVHVACMSMMRFITNVYNYSTQQATSFRQHIITSTSWVDQVVLPYVMKLIQQVAASFDLQDQKWNVATVSAANAPPQKDGEVPKEVVQGLVCSLRFLALVTFHMGSYGRNLRFINSLSYDLLQLPKDHFIAPNIEVYAALVQFNVNIDSLAGEDRLPQAEHLPAECTSDSLKANIATMFSALNQKQMATFKQHFYKSHQAMLARDVASFAVVEDLLDSAEKHTGTPASASNEGSKGEFRLLGDLPDPAKVPVPNNAKEQDRAVPDEPVMMDDQLVRPRAEVEAHAYVQAEGDAPARFRCSLNGHLMKDPMRSPHGHVFERDSIMKWIDHSGSTCPITGKLLQLKDLTPDKELSFEITSWHISQQSKVNEEDDYDMYDF